MNVGSPTRKGPVGDEKAAKGPVKEGTRNLGERDSVLEERRHFGEQRGLAEKAMWHEA